MPIGLSENHKKLSEQNSAAQSERTKIDPFFHLENRAIFEQLYYQAKELSEKTEFEDLTYVIAVETSSGNLYNAVIYNPLEDSAELKKFLNNLRSSSDTFIKYSVGFVCDIGSSCCLEMPSAHMRKAFCELDKRNLETKMLLQGLNAYIVKSFKDSFSQGTVLKYS